MKRITIPLALALLLASPAHAEPNVEVHYSPVENLEHIDVRQIDAAQHRIDAAIYVLTDWAVIAAFKRALARGVEVRLLLDATQNHATDQFKELTPWIRYKQSSVYMHLKSYAIDRAILRTGAANFSDSGEKRQDNDLVLIRSPELAQAFEARFDRMWKDARP